MKLLKTFVNTFVTFVNFNLLILSQVPRDANERVQTYGQPSPTSVTVPLEARVHPVSSDGVDITAPTQDNSQRDNRPADVAAAVNAG